jgi:ankyrin repeat protein
MNLINAARGGDVARVRALLAAGADVNAADPTGTTALIGATADAHWEAARLLLEAGADVNAQDRSGCTALHGAAGCEDGADVVRILLRAGARTEVRARMSMLNGTPLMWAAAQGRTETVQVLVAAGADVNAGDEQGTTPLMRAAQAGHAATVRALLAGGAAVNDQNGRGATALMAAAGMGHRAIVRVLLLAKADVNLRMQNGATALFMVTVQQKPRMVRRLLDAGADPNVATAEGKTALFVAVEKGRRRLVQRLLDAGANPNVALQEYDTFDADLAKGTTPLMLAALKGRRRMVETLLRAGADVEARNDRGEGALALAAAKGFVKVMEQLRAAGAAEAVDERAFQAAALLKAAALGEEERVKALLQAGTDPNVPNSEPCDHGKTPIIYAAEHGHAGVIRLLLAAGAAVDAAEPTSMIAGTGRTALLYAAAQGHTEALRALLAAGANANAVDHAGTTALIHAAARGDLQAVRALMEAGADLNLKNQDPGQSALEAAAGNGHDLVVAALLAAGGVCDGNALCAAAQGAHPGVVRILLDAGVWVDAREDRPPRRSAMIAATEVQTTVIVSQTRERVRESDPAPWFTAIETRQREVLQGLLQAGAAVDARDQQGRTALIAAAGRHGCISVKAEAVQDAVLTLEPQTVSLTLLRLLLNAGADVNAQNAEGCTALMQVADIDTRFWPSPVPALEVLLAAGARVELRDHNGATALVRAGVRGDEGVIRVLLGAGADVNVQANDGGTALHQAVHCGQDAGVLALVQAGADVNVRDGKGETPLLVAVQERADEALRALLAAGADFQVQDADGNNALDRAFQLNWDEGTELLQQAGAIDTNFRDRALREAVESFDRARVQQLLAEGADMHRLAYGRDAFALALGSGRLQLVQDLIAAGADVNRVYANEGPALILAVSGGHVDLVRCLLTAGADANATSAQGWSALLTAGLQRNGEIVQTLLAAGARTDLTTAAVLQQFAFAAAARQPDFEQAVAELAEACAAPALPIDWLPGVFVFHVAPGAEAEERLRAEKMQSRFWAEYATLEEKVRAIVTDMQPRLLKRGYFAWNFGRGIGCGPAGQFVGLAPTADKYAVIAAVGTNGGNYEVYTPEILGFLRDMERDDPFQLVGCGGDFLDILFPQPVKDPRGLAERMYRLCSDMVEQGVGSLEALVEHLRVKQHAHFWWD